MKTSLICLLLLAAVACAAPRTGEKRAGISEQMREKMVEKSKEIAEKMRERSKEKREEMANENSEEMAEEMWEETAEKREEMAEEKREESENEVPAAKFDGEAESRYGYCFGVCYSAYGEVGCYYDFCYRRYDTLFYDYYLGCWCCSDHAAPYSCYGYSY